MAVAQETPAPDKAAPASDAPAPAAVKPADRPDLKPAKVEPRVAPTDLKPTPPDLPPLPEAAKTTDKKNKTKTDDESALVPEKVPNNKKNVSVIGTTAERPKTRTALLPPMTQLDADLRVRYRQAETKAMQDPTVMSAFEESRVAMTDFDKRAAMKSYYERLYKKMLSYDKGIAPLVEDRQRYNLRRMSQTRVAPTEGLPDVDGVSDRGGGGLPYLGGR